jgi:hypothetical protein
MYKKAIFLSFAFSLNLFFLIGQSSYILDFEDGDRSYYNSLCYSTPGMALKSSSGGGNPIEGTSARTGQLTSMTMNHGIITPCTQFNGSNGNLTFSHYVHTLAGSSNKQLEVVLIDMVTHNEEEVFAYTYSNTSLITSSIPIAASGNYKIQFKWNGTGGQGRGWLDNVTVPGMYNASLNDCGCETAFPVKWASFEGEYRLDRTVLNWETTQEINNDYFEIERSVDGKSFTKIGKIEGQGNTETSTQYQFADETSAEIKAGKVYYRLRQVDFNGQFSMSDVIEVNLNPAGLKVTMYPNPVSDFLNLEYFLNPREEASVSIRGIDGQILYEERIIARENWNKHVIPVDKMSRGIYHLVLTTQNEVVAKPFQIR